MNKPVVIEKTRRELELNYLPKNHEATAKHLPDVYYKNKKMCFFRNVHNFLQNKTTFLEIEPLLLFPR